MGNRATPRTSVALALVLLMVVEAASTRQARADQARRFGLFGLARGETARLNVVNVALADVCVVQLQFLQPDGTVIKESGTKTLSPGESVTLDVARKTQATGSLRKQMRAVVRQINLNTSASCITTLEIFNSSTGQSEVLVGNFEQ